MSGKEIDPFDIYLEMLKMFKSLPDPKHQPDKFKFLVATFLYVRKEMS
jgi:hypothetical protein